MKTSFLATAAVVALASAPANAATFVFTSDEFTLSFNLPDSPIPAFVAPGVGFQAPPTSGMFNGSAQAFPNIVFLSEDYDENTGVAGAFGGFSYDGSFQNLFSGAQLYSGTEANPTFLAGTYQLADFDTGAAGTLVISLAGAVPEPATWALLILGFGMTGAAMRRRSASVAFSYA